MSTEILDIRKAKAKNSDNIAVFVLTSKKHQNHHSQPHNMKKSVETVYQTVYQEQKLLELATGRSTLTVINELLKAEFRPD